MSSSHSLNQPPVDSPKKSSICSTRSAESDGDKRVNFKNDGEKKHSFSEGKELTKTGSKKEKRDGSKDREKGEHSPSDERKLTKKGSLKELVKRDSLRDISNKAAGEQVPKKFISTWRMACDKTKDRTKELLKKWRTVPEGSLDATPSQEHSEVQSDNHGWSVHVWTTWVKRYPSDEDRLSSDDLRINTLTPVQTEKLKHFFSHVLDMDRDDMISLQDFESFTERLRHFADWSTNCGEYLVLQQVQQGFVETFLVPEKSEDQETPTSVNMDRLFLSLDDWLLVWSDLLTDLKAVYEFPVWLQYMAKVLFQAINTSGSGKVSKEELSSFYLSVMGYQKKKVDEILDKAFKAMTSNGEHSLNYYTYELIFANFFLGRYPNGPGHYLFGYEPKDCATFPIDYTALNTAPEDLEHYSPDTRSNRRSVIV